MNYLAKHIETLIWQHECVIVPQFGGFVTQVQSAYTTDPEGLFMPPAHTVGFNDKLLGNDGILVHSYMEVYGLQEGEAKRLLQSDILDMREQLLHQSSYDLGRLGVLKQDEDGEIHFTPNNGWTAPDFFGLDALDFPMLEEKATVQYAPDPSLSPSDSKSSENITLSINRRMLHTALSVAAAILLFFMVSTPVNNNVWNKNQALLSQDILASALTFMPRMETTTPVQQPNDSIKAKQQTQPSGSEAGTPETSLNSNPSVAGETSEEFAVVIASAIPEDNARDYVTHLHDKGFTDACIYRHGAMIRVLFRGFASETEALKKMRALQSSPEFQAAWILQLK